jgi:hypothetical protein
MLWALDVLTIFGCCVLCYGAMVLHERLVEWLARRREE